MQAIYSGLESAKIIAFCNANVFFLRVDFLCYIDFFFPGPVVQTSLK